ncbi:MgtC/SapB family protein [Longispora sp. NPDC051575]|uniref:MgtC/SapB family protein n=1 Tax=Longispora sp. NPDC051575 TaxID=3154943 RepID=UPI003429FD5D
MMTPASFALGLTTGLAAGTLIGVERQWRQRMAGLRTHALVAAGAAMFVMLSGAFADSSPSRVAAQVVSGVGFLGAGVIMRDGFTVTGINTAATLWCSAAVGSLAGARQYGYALAAGAAVVAVNVVLRAAGRRIDREPGSGDEVFTGWRVETTLVPPDDGRVRTALLTALRTVDGARVRAVETVRTDGTIQIRADLTGTADTGPALDAALSGISRDPTVTGTSWRHLADQP